MFWVTGEQREGYLRLIIEAASTKGRLELLQKHYDVLEKRADWLVEQWHYERERANRAVDNLLIQKGLAPITPDPRPETLPDPMAMWDEPEASVEAMRKRIQEDGLDTVMEEARG